MSYRYALSLTSQFYFCGLPLRLDSYKGCPSKCIYCFVGSRQGNFLKDIQYANPVLIGKWFELALEQNSKTDNVLIECLRRRMPIHFGGMSDPLLIHDSFKHVTLEILKILDKYKYPTLLSTKANIISNSEFSSIILGKSHFAIQLSFSTFNDAIASIVEPHAPLPSERLKGACSAIKSGNWIACRFQPYLPSQDVDDLVRNISSEGFNHLTIEHFKLPFDGQININKLNSAFNINILKLFPKGKRIARGREYEMPNDIRLPEILKFIKASAKYKISIGIGDNGFQHLSTSLCCCGIDLLQGFENWNKHNITVALKRTAKDNAVNYKSIVGEWAPKSNISMMINSKTRLTKGCNTIIDHIKCQWHYNTQFSPKFFHNVVSEKNGDTYKYYIK